MEGPDHEERKTGGREDLRERETEGNLERTLKIHVKKKMLKIVITRQ